MKVFNNNVMPLLAFFVGLMALSKISSAQGDLKLDNVAGIELVTRGGGLSNYYLKVEVVKENNTWKCYQIRIRKPATTKDVNDSTRTYLRDAPAGMLTNLLDIISKKDTSIDVSLFKLNNSELVTGIDSLYPYLGASQKTKLIEAVKSQDTVKKALVIAFHPFPMDDKTYYGITVKTKNGQSSTLSALSFASLYNLPWRIDGVDSYDPDISIIFEYLCGHDRFALQQRRFLNRDVVRNVYRILYGSYR